MEIIDTHVHAVEIRDPETVIEQSGAQRWKNGYSYSELLTDMDVLGISRSIIVSAPIFGRNQTANAYTIQAMNAHPERLYGVGLMDFTVQENRLGKVLRDTVSHPNMLGIRLHASWGPDSEELEYDTTSEWIIDETYHRLWAEARRKDIPMHIMIFPQQLYQIDTILDRFSDVDIVIDHLGWPDPDTPVDEGPWKTLEEIAKHQNTYIKISMLPRLSNEGFPYEDMFPFISKIFEWFDRSQILFGSNQPSIRAGATYEESVRWTEEQTFLSQKDLKWMYSRSATNLYQFTST